jgi:NADP-dependent 3-hydroxy acid dehydrogenase YdfG
VRSISQGLQQEANAAGYPLRVSVVASAKLDPSAESAPNDAPVSLSATDVTNTVLHLISQPLHVDVSYTELRANGQY